MEQKVASVRWSRKALDSLQIIHDFYASKSLQAAENVTNDVFSTAESVIFLHQYQIDEYHKDCRRIVCRHFKILYRVKDSTAFIINIIDTRMNSSNNIETIDD